MAVILYLLSTVSLTIEIDGKWPKLMFNMVKLTFDDQLSCDHLKVKITPFSLKGVCIIVFPKNISEREATTTYDASTTCNNILISP